MINDLPLMQPLNLPAYPFRMRQQGDKALIFDAFRKKYVALTPEEWVRQHFLAWLALEKFYPVGLIAVEAPLKYHRMAKRADAIIYDQQGKALMIIECKAPEVKITQKVFDQVARYNLPFQVAYLVVTNGMEHFCCKMNDAAQGWAFLDQVPDYLNL
ncbi:MAG: type I restriction enzyme HsdR N-terminal domain-containing protein [Bacteroidales bacterium]